MEELGTSNANSGWPTRRSSRSRLRTSLGAGRQQLAFLFDASRMEGQWKFRDLSLVSSACACEFSQGTSWMVELLAIVDGPGALVQWFVVELRFARILVTYRHDSTTIYCCCLSLEVTVAGISEQQEWQLAVAI